MKKILLVFSLFALANSLQAKEYSIYICRAKLEKVVTIPVQYAGFLAGFYHVYLKNNNDKQLHFEPRNPNAVLGSPARIGNQSYGQAHGEECYEVLKSTSRDHYVQKWAQIEVHFEQEAQISFYNALSGLKLGSEEFRENFLVQLALNAGGIAGHKNCQMVAEGALASVDLENKLPKDTNVVTQASLQQAAEQASAQVGTLLLNLLFGNQPR